jgi:hypothetical protein
MKSLCTSGIFVGWPPPGPVPNSPPVPRPSSDWLSWNPFSYGSANGSSQVSTRTLKFANGPPRLAPRLYARKAPPKNRPRPMISQLTRSVAM